jgi:flagellar hook-associated protein 1 FlgK
MGLTGSALEIGKSALLAYQSALQVVGNNVSNAGSTSYARQTPILSPSPGAPLPEGFTPGGGVTLSALKRNIDDALENRIRIAMGDQSSTQVQQDMLGRIEGIMNELSDSDLSSLLSALFNSFSSLQNTPQDGSTRGIVLTAANSVATELQRQRTAVLQLQSEANTNLVDAAKEADKLLHDIADLNVQITSVESSQPGGANSLRDQRDDLLRQLGDLMQVQVREQDDGGLNVYVGNELLIQGGYTRGITTTTETASGYPTTVVRFADNNGQVTLQGGKMAGLITARDTDIMGQINNLDQLAATLINEINRVHAQGQGLEGFTTVTGANDVLDPSAVLNSAAAGLALQPRNGSFQLTVTDKSAGTSVVTNIKVDLLGAGTDDSLASLAAKINSQVANVTATVTPDNHLKLTAASGFEMTFGQDSSNVLASLGINTFLTGHDASDIAVNSVLTSNPQLLAAATSRSAGDGSNAGALAALATTSLDSLGGRSITQAYNDLVANVANKGAAAKSSTAATQSIYSSLSAQRESISGVNLDEETISLMKLERSFQGAARFVSVVDSLLQEMLSIVK